MRRFGQIVDPSTTIVKYETCDANTQIQAFTYKSETWWRISCPRMPDRWVKLTFDKSLKHLISKFGYLDSGGCLNSRYGTFQSAALQDIQSDVTLDALNRDQRRVKGVPQRTHNSGLCWFGAFCFCVFFCRQMKEFVLSYMPRELRLLTDGVLEDLNKAEQLRKHLYNKYAFGDRPGQDPELDGQNGVSQFCVLAARLGIPVIRLMAPSLQEITDPSVYDQKGERRILRSLPKEGEGSLLIVRCFRTRWTPRRRLVREGRRYKLCAIMIGSEYCGHQIGVSTCDMHVCRWALADSDASREGIGPMFWCIERRRGESPTQFRERWRAMWDIILPATNFGRSKVCDFNPTNRPTHDLETHNAARRRPTNSRPGLVNPDYIYLHIPAERA